MHMLSCSPVPCGSQCPQGAHPFQAILVIGWALRLTTSTFHISYTPGRAQESTLVVSVGPQHSRSASPAERGLSFIKQRGKTQNVPLTGGPGGDLTGISLLFPTGPGEARLHGPGAVGRALGSQWESGQPEGQCVTLTPRGPPLPACILYSYRGSEQTITQPAATAKQQSRSLKVLL